MACERCRGERPGVELGRLVLEVNATVPLDATILRRWREEGGARITFGSDAHEPWALGNGLDTVAASAESQGFRPDARPEHPWIIGQRR